MPARWGVGSSVLGWAQIGMELGAISEAAAALVAARPLSVLILPLGALTVLLGGDRAGAESENRVGGGYEERVVRGA